MSGLIQRNPSTGRIIRRNGGNRILRVSRQCAFCGNLGHPTPKALTVTLAGWTDCPDTCYDDGSWGFLRWRRYGTIADKVNGEYRLAWAGSSASNRVNVCGEMVWWKIAAVPGCCWCCIRTGDFGAVDIYYYQDGLGWTRCEEPWYRGRVYITHLEFAIWAANDALLWCSEGPFVGVALTIWGRDNVLPGDPTTVSGSIISAANDSLGHCMPVDGSENCFEVSDYAPPVCVPGPNGCSLNDNGIPVCSLPRGGVANNSINAQFLIPGTISVTPVFA